MLKMYQEKMKEILEQKSSQEQELKKQLEALIRRQKKIAKTGFFTIFFNFYRIFCSKPVFSRKRKTKEAGN